MYVKIFEAKSLENFEHDTLNNENAHLLCSTLAISTCEGHNYMYFIIDH